MAVLNNFTKEVRTLLLADDISQSKIAEKLGTHRANVSQAIHAEVVNRAFTKILDAMGYDIKITYLKKGEDGEHIKTINFDF